MREQEIINALCGSGLTIQFEEKLVVVTSNDYITSSNHYCGFRQKFKDLDNVVSGKTELDNWILSEPFSYRVQIYEFEDAKQSVLRGEQSFSGHINNVNGLPVKIFIDRSVCEKLIQLEARVYPGFAKRVLVECPVFIFTRTLS